MARLISNISTPQGTLRTRHTRHTRHIRYDFKGLGCDTMVTPHYQGVTGLCPRNNTGYDGCDTSDTSRPIPGGAVLMASLEQRHGGADDQGQARGSYD